ncbi:hypothetical protein HDU77_011466, partial [Chytriomyces hyalinus]
MEDTATIENGRLEEAFEEEAQSSRQSPTTLENHQAGAIFRLDDFSCQIPSSRQSFSITQSPLRDEDLPVRASQDANVESCQDEQPSHSSHESLTKQSVLPSTSFDGMKEQPVLQPSAGFTGEEATRPTTIKRETSLVYAEKRTPKTSIQQWAS